MKLGVTGGIGSGKTTVCRIFRALGVPVFSADQEARIIMEEEDIVRSRINSIAGKDLYLNGSLDRTQLASLIFNNSNLLEKVNALVHPVVFDRFRSWCMEQGTSYVIMEAAILFESGAYGLVDRIAVVTAPVDERIRRVIGRNNMTAEQVSERIRNQIDDESRIVRADYVIKNAENDMITPVVLKIHEEMLKLSV